MAEGAQARSLAVQLGIPLGRAWTRGARLLRNPRMEDQGLTAHRLRRGGQGRRRMAFDGTAGHHDFKRLLASVIRAGLRYGGSQAAVLLGDRA